MIEKIIGHSQVINFFDKVIDNAGLSHAYCFVGEEHLGKRKVAEYLASKILEVVPAKLYTNFDFVFVDQEIDEKTEKTKRDITVKQIRDLREQLSKRSYAGGYKVAIIDNAEKMNNEAANALLKTLEEPAHKTIIFLLTKDEKQLPETIISRCQLINFFPIANQEMINNLTEVYDKNCVSEVVDLANGLPGMAINWLENKESLVEYKKEIQRFRSLFGEPFYKKLSIVDDLFGDKTDHIAARQHLLEVLDIWQIELLKHKEKIDNVKNVFLQDQIFFTKDLLLKNVHPRLLVENILLNIP